MSNTKRRNFFFPFYYFIYLIFISIFKLFFFSHRHKLLDGEVVSELSVTSVAPGVFVNGHAVFPLVFHQVSRLVAVSAGVVPSVVTDAVQTPPIVRHHCFSNRTEGVKTKTHEGSMSKGRVSIFEKRINYVCVFFTFRCTARLRNRCCSSTGPVHFRPRQTTAPLVCTSAPDHTAQAEFWWWGSSLS